MSEQEKITIIEGPPPTFELVNDPWLLGLTESSVPTQVAMCQVRTFDGAALLERCTDAWRDGEPITLEFRNEDGLTQEAPIIASRRMELEEGQILLLWVLLDVGDIEVDFDFDEFDDDYDDSDYLDLDL